MISLIRDNFISLLLFTWCVVVLCFYASIEDPNKTKDLGLILGAAAGSFATYITQKLTAKQNGAEAERAEPIEGEENVERN